MISKVLQCSVLALVICTLALVHLNEAVVKCPSQCVCNPSVTVCHNFIPFEDTGNIDRLIIKSFDVDSKTHFGPGLFGNLTYLEMSDVRGILPNKFFSGLKNLKQFKLKMDADNDLSNGDNAEKPLSKDVFANLGKVETLDLSNNSKVGLKNILTALDNKNGNCLPALKTLYLRKIQSRLAGSIDIDYAFVTTIALRRVVEYIDMSGTTINIFNLNSIDWLCLTINTLVLRDSFIGSAIFFNEARPCAALKTLDLAGSRLPLIRDNVEYYFERLNCDELDWCKTIENLDVSQFIQATEPIEKLDLTFLSECNFSLKQVVARQNNIKVINHTYGLDKPFQESIIHLDISSNVIEYYHPTALNVVRNVQRLNLSSNHLHVMQSNQPNEFEILFSQCSHLVTLDISFNMLTSIPSRTFVNNTHLKFLNLSGNKLTSFDVLLHYLTNLEFIDLSSNHIVTLSTYLWSRLDFLNQQRITVLETSNQTNVSNDKGANVRFTVNLSFNPFTCDCEDENKKFLEWISQSETLFRSNKTIYSCQLENEQLDVSLSALERSEAVCRRKEILRILMYVLPITMGICVGVLLRVICIQKHRRRIQNIEKTIQDIKENTFPRKFLVFLSYSSEDCEFVHQYIYPPMNQMFVDITECDRDLICFGDRHFHAGSPVHTEVVRCMEECAVVVFVVSNTFCRKGWCQAEVDEAYDQKKQIIMLMREHVDLVEMPKFLRTIFNRYTHASWVQDDHGAHIEPGWNDLCRDIIELASKQADYRQNNGKAICMANLNYVID